MHRILIVPDALLREEVGPSFLDRGQLSVRSAQSGEDALAMAATWRPDLVILGSRLPGLAGEALVVGLRRTLGAAGRLLLLADPADPLRAGPGEAELDARLVTPVDPADVLRTIAALLDVRLREAPRVAVRLLARLCGAVEAEREVPTVVNVLDLSERGARIEAPCRLRVGAAGTLQAVLPGAVRRLTLPIGVTVLLDELLLHYGVAFVSPSAADQADLKAFVAERIGAAAREEEAAGA